MQTNKGCNDSPTTAVQSQLKLITVVNYLCELSAGIGLFISKEVILLLDLMTKLHI